jgi:guanosine-3',5'-bis(diphosphate) 3'-pyrophosphohydrolase
MAKKMHENQFRDSGDPYILHPLSVLEKLKKYDFPEDVLVAAVLHDVCEDTDISNMEIINEFSERVGFLLYALSKNNKGKNKDSINYRFSLYINRFHMSVIADPAVLFIKMADQIDNLKTIDIFSLEKQKRKISELENYFLPIYEKSEGIITRKYFNVYKELLIELKVLILNTKKNFS